MKKAVKLYVRPILMKRIIGSVSSEKENQQVRPMRVYHSLCFPKQMALTALLQLG